VTLRSRVVDGMFTAIELFADLLDAPRRVKRWWARRGLIAPDRCDLQPLRDLQPSRTQPLPLTRKSSKGH